MPIQRTYGCVPDLADARDRLYRPRAIKLATEVDLTDSLPPVLDQETIGSCVLHGTSEAFRARLKADGRSDIAPSRLQFYYDTRVSEGTAGEDAGCQIRDAIKILRTTGVAPESDWPYIVSRYFLAPPPSVNQDRVGYPDFDYERVDVDAVAVKTALSEGFPVIIGLSLYDSFEGDTVAATGIVPMPNLQTERVVGGHCMLAIGYGQHSGLIKVRNSWGADWGDKGNCYIPEEIIGSTDYGSDYWIIKPKIPTIVTDAIANLRANAYEYANLVANTLIPIEPIVPDRVNET